jgi:ABC-type Fe3+/spermidine/putrescine transport system ATPase subunit
MLLHARSLQAARGAFQLDVAELSIDRGEVLAVIGPNGAGKSTLFRILALLDRPDSGSITMDGEVVSPSDAAARRRTAAVFQRPHLFAGSVGYNVGLGLRSRGVPAAEVSARGRAALESLGIVHREGADVRHLSGGEAQRVAIARALVLEPELLLLDEPAAALDAVVRVQLLADLERLVRDRRRGVILITHDPRDAFMLADRVAILEGGRILQVGTPAELLVAPASPHAAALTGAELLLDGVVVALMDDFVEVRLPGGRHLIATAPPGGTAAAGVAVHVAYRPEDVVLGDEHAFARTSLTNSFPLTVAEVRLAPGGSARVRFAGPPALVAVITRRSCETLDVRTGRTLDVALKATALHTFRSV